MALVDFRRLQSLRRHLVVFAGGVVGAALRWWAGRISPAAPGTWPVATLVVNLSGAFVLGVYLIRRQRAVTARFSLEFWAIGMLGSFTTFSALSLEVVLLADSGRTALAAGYALASTLGGLLLAWLGGRIGRVL